MQRPSMIQMSTIAVAVLGTLALSGCGGGGSGAGPQDSSAQISTTGLFPGASVSLLNHGANALTIDTNGTQAFPGNWTGASYAVTVKSHSPGITCAVTNGSGSLGGAAVTVDLSCDHGAVSILHSFGPGTATDGQGPHGGLVTDASADLFGTTQYGGTNNTGTVYELTPGRSGYSESILYSFAGNPSLTGYYPVGRLVLDSSGKLYGVASSGGNGNGTVYELMRSGTTYNLLLLISFAVAADGSQPRAGLLLDSSGDLYGTTANGGANSQGTVFELD